MISKITMLPVGTLPQTMPSDVNAVALKTTKPSSSPFPCYELRQLAHNTDETHESTASDILCNIVNGDYSYAGDFINQHATSLPQFIDSNQQLSRDTFCEILYPDGRRAMDIVGNETWMIPDRNPAYKVLCSPIDTCASESMASHAFSSPDVYQWKLPLLEQEPETSVSNSQVDQSLKHKEIRRSLEQSLLVCKSGREPINKAASTPTPKKKNTVDSGSSRKRNAGSRNGQCDHQKTSSKKGDGEDMVDVSGMAEDGDQGTRKKTRQQTSSKLPHKDLEMTTETNPDVGQSLGIYPAITSMDRSEEVLIDASSARAEISKAGIASVGEEGGERTAHISVERNRRKQMNEHLAILRSLMPSSYVQRSDQASVIGGVIEFIKELQQLLTSLETQKRRRTYVMESINPRMANKGSIPHGNVIDQLNLQGVKQELVASSRSEFADVEVKLAGGCEVLLRALCHKVERGQLQHLIAALECLSLQILHLNITTVQQSILYTFTLKIGIDCQLSVDDLAAVGQQIFKEIHGRSI